MPDDGIRPSEAVNIKKDAREIGGYMGCKRAFSAATRPEVIEEAANI